MVDANGRHYTTNPLHAPGETRNGDTGRMWKGMLPPKGRHWRYDPKVFDELDAKGLIAWSATGNPRKIVYADEMRKFAAQRSICSSRHRTVSNTGASTVACTDACT